MNVRFGAVKDARYILQQLFLANGTEKPYTPMYHIDKPQDLNEEGLTRAAFQNGRRLGLAEAAVSDKDFFEAIKDGRVFEEPVVASDHMPAQSIVEDMISRVLSISNPKEIHPHQLIGEAMHSLREAYNHISRISVKTDNGQNRIHVGPYKLEPELHTSAIDAFQRRFEDALEAEFEKHKRKN